MKLDKKLDKELAEHFNLPQPPSYEERTVRNLVSGFLGLGGLGLMVWTFLHFGYEKILSDFTGLVGLWNLFPLIVVAGFIMLILSISGIRGE